MNYKFQRMMVLAALTKITKAQEGVKIRIIQEEWKEEEVLIKEEAAIDLIKGTFNAIIAISMDTLRGSVDLN